MSRLNRTILVLLVLVGAPFYWFLIDNSGPKAEPQPIAIAQLRELSATQDKPGPVRIRFEQIAMQTHMGNRIASGTGLRWVELYTLSYLLEYADAAPVLIGSGLTAAEANRIGKQKFDSMAQRRVTRALARSRMLIPLVPSPDQLGGLRMLGETRQARALDAQLARQQTADRAGIPHRVAPGVVVIPTPDLQPGSRLVYARLANGREYLFAGNLAPIRDSWSQLRLPARIVTDIGRIEDRRAIRSWLLTLKALKRQSPGLVIVSGNRVPRHVGLLQYFDESANILL